MDRSEFLRVVKILFPSLRQEINKQQGLLHFEVGVLRRYTQQAILDGDKSTTVSCFRIAEQAYVGGNKKLKVAIDTSYVEDLDFVTPENTYEWAWNVLPIELKALYKAFHGDRFDATGRLR